MASFGPSSRKRLESCHCIIKDILNMAITYYDFTIIEGHRTELLQNEYYRTGKSKVIFPNGKHNKYPSHAVDIAPWINGKISWDEKSCAYLAGIIEMCAHKVCENNKRNGLPIFKLRWGGDWDGDRDLTDQTFDDLVHFEIIIKEDI